MRKTIYITIILSILTAMPALSYTTKLGAGGNVTFAFPLGDLAKDDLDSGYQTMPLINGRLIFAPLHPFVLEGGGTYGVAHTARTGITEGDADWRANTVYAGGGLLFDMRLWMPHITGGISYYWIDRTLGIIDPEDRDRIISKDDSLTSQGFYIEIGVERYIYEHIAIDVGIRFDQARTEGRRASFINIGGGVHWYLF